MHRDESALVAAARAGDERAFVELTAAHRGALHAHCYRLLGSVHDADDALQETMLRASRGLDRFAPRAPLRAWLYRIATNVCLRMLERRSRAPISADAHLEPYPDESADGPAAAIERRETIGLAFVAAVQLLPPKQRVVLVLRDVLDWSAREVADLLDDTLAAVNSALQRARERIARESADGSHIREPAPADARIEACSRGSASRSRSAIKRPQSVREKTGPSPLGAPITPFARNAPSSNRDWRWSCPSLRPSSCASRGTRSASRRSSRSTATPSASP